MTEHNILITRIADGKQYSEESLAELLKDEGIRQFDNILGLGFRAWRSAWFVNIHDYTIPPPHYREFTLDPAKYRISFANSIDKSEVEKIIEEIKAKIDSDSFYSHEYEAPVLVPSDLKQSIDRIANRYLLQQT